MNLSLYVEKTDGDREVLEEASMEMARAVFAKVDWDSEMAVVKAAEESGKEVFLPEFGISDEGYRTLVISPIDPGTVSFYIQSPDRVFGAQSFPKNDADRLIGMFYQGLDDDIEALAAKPRAAGEIPVRELSDAEFRATIVPPMRHLGDEERERQVPLRDYISSCIVKYSMGVTLNTIQLTDIFLAADKKYSHIYFDFGDTSRFLVVVVKHDPENNEDAVEGHFFASDPGSYYS